MWYAIIVIIKKRLNYRCLGYKFKSYTEHTFYSLALNYFLYM